MKNKGRKHKGRTLDCKGWLMGITRDITKMGNRGRSKSLCTDGTSNKFMKKKWSKRVRGYFKSQTKEFLCNID
jgi:hypothetical protein